jgi:hypothetical protein
MTTEYNQIEYSSTLSKKRFDHPGCLELRNTNIAEGFVEEMPPCRLGEIDEFTADDVDTSKPLHEYGIDSLLRTASSGWISKSPSVEVGFLDITNR